MLPELSHSRLYFVHPFVDFLFVGAGSIAAFFLIPWIWGAERSPEIVQAGVTLAWFVNWPHFSATHYRLYRSTDHVRQYPLTALLIPLAVAAAAAASLDAPSVLAPYLVKLFLLWSSYHFCAQSLGISLVYARRAGYPIHAPERTALSGFIFSTFLAQTSAAETGTGQFSYYGVKYPALGLPEIVAHGLGVWTWITGAAVIVLFTRRALREKRAVPAIVLLPAVTQYFWFVLGASTPSFSEFVPFFHSLQYLLVAWVVQLRERLDSSGAAPTRRFAAVETAKWLAINLAGGAALFCALPEAVRAFGYPRDLALPIVIAGVQIHHFFVDGVIWKLRSPRVGSVLLSTLRDLSGGPATAGAPGVLPKTASASRSISALAIAFAVGVAGLAAFAGRAWGGAPSFPPVLADERIVLQTTHGDLVLALYPEIAPKHVEQLLKLARAGVYDSVTFYRVHPDFVAQVNDARHRSAPLTPEQQALIRPLPEEIHPGLSHLAGALSMARHENLPGSAETSFSILLGPAPHLDGKFTVFGHLERGYEALQAMVAAGQDESYRPKERIEILKAVVVPAAELRSFPFRAHAAPRRRTLAAWPVIALLALGSLAVVLAARLGAGPRTFRSLGLLGLLAAFFLGFSQLAPLASSAPWMAAALFFSTIGVFRLMAVFEPPEIR